MCKRFWIVGFCLFVPLTAAASSIMVGNFAISPSDVLRTLLGGGGSTHASAIFQIRLPYIILTILVESALGASGAILQGIAENPPAESGMIDINAGNALFVISWISYGASAHYSSLSNVKVLFIPLPAITGAFCIATFLHAYSWRKGIRPIRFLPTGAGVNAGITAMISFYQL